MANVSGVFGSSRNFHPIFPSFSVQKSAGQLRGKGFIDTPESGGVKSGYRLDLGGGSKDPKPITDFSAKAIPIDREPTPESESPDPTQPGQRPGRIDFKA